jgi:hypothetical protein
MKMHETVEYLGWEIHLKFKRGVSAERDRWACEYDKIGSCEMYSEFQLFRSKEEALLAARREIDKISK